MRRPRTVVKNDETGAEREEKAGLARYEYHELGPSIPCVHCGRGAPIYLEPLFEFFRGKETACAGCGKAIDWVNALDEAAEFALLGFSAVGAMTTHFYVEIVANRTIQVDFTRYTGENARILWVNYTPHGPGGVFPLEVHGNTPLRSVHLSKVRLFGRPMADSEESAKQKVGVAVCWVSADDSDESWQNLVDAFEYFHAHRYNSIIVPANVAVEIRLTGLVERFLNQHVQSGVPDFLSDGATYGHQLNILLPMIASISELPALPAKLRDRLKDLKAKRNQVAHEGAPKETLSKTISARLLTAAVLGVVYIEMLEQALFPDTAEAPEEGGQSPPESQQEM